MTFTNRQSDAFGFGVIERATSPSTDWMGTSYVPLNLCTNRDGFVRTGDPPVRVRDPLRRDSFDVNNGQAIAYLPEDARKDTHGRHPAYAFVTGFNFYREGDPSANPCHPDRIPGLPAGGSIGIIRDPAGLFGKVVAVTRPIPYAFPDNLVLSPDGEYLYAAYRFSAYGLNGRPGSP